MLWFPANDLEVENLRLFLDALIDGGFNPREPYYGLGITRQIDDAPRLVAAAVYSDFRVGSCEIAFAASTPAWATKQTIAYVLGYAFWEPPQGMGMRRLTSISKIGNKRDHKLIEGIGFRREGTLLDSYPDCDGAIHGMTRRWFLRSKWNDAQTFDKHQRAACA